jgi:hypothetical protein
MSTWGIGGLGSPADSSTEQEPFQTCDLFFSFFPGSWLKGNYATRELGNVPCGFSTCFISASLNAVAFKLLLGTFKPMLLFVVNGSFTASLYFCELVTSICHSSTFSLRQIFPKSLE